MKRLKSKKYMLAIMLTIIGILFSNYFHAQEKQYHFITNKLLDAIEDISKKSKGKITPSEIQNLISFDSNIESEVQSIQAPNTGEYIEVDPIIVLVSYEGNNNVEFVITGSPNAPTDISFEFTPVKTPGWVTGTLNQYGDTLTCDVSANGPNARSTGIIITAKVDGVEVTTAAYIIQEGEPDPFILISPMIQAFSYKEQTTDKFNIIHFNITGWEVGSNLPDWITEGEQDHTGTDDFIKFELELNTRDIVRDTIIIIQEIGNPNVADTLTIYQGAESVSSILITPEIQSFSYKEQTTDKFNIIHFNISGWEVGSNLPDWITEGEQSHTGTDDFIKFELERNTRDTVRDTIIIIQEIGNPNVADTLTIYQGAESPVPVIIIEPEVQVFSFEEQPTEKFNIVHFNITDWEVGSNLPDWITEGEQSHTGTDDFIKFELERNTRDIVLDTIIIIQEIGNPNVADTLTIYQGAEAVSSILITPEIQSFSYKEQTTDEYNIIHFNITGWEVGSNLPDWITEGEQSHTGTDDFIKFELERNTRDIVRDTIIIIQEIGNPNVADTLTIYQGAESVSSILVTPEILTINHEGTPESNGIKIIHFNIVSWEDDIDYIYPNDVNDWIPLVKHYAPADPFDSITLTINQNFTDDYREANVIIYETDNTDIADTIRVIQGAYSKPSILVYPKVQTVGHGDINTNDFHVVNFNIDDWKVVDKENLPYGITVIEPEDHTFEHGLVKFHSPATDLYTSRIAGIRIEEVGDPDVFDSLFIVQDAKPNPYLIASPRVQSVGHNGLPILTFDVKSGNLNGLWTVDTVHYIPDPDDEWISSGNMPQALLTISAAENHNKYTRKAEIHIHANEGEVKDTVTVFQYADTSSYILTAPREQIIPWDYKKDSLPKSLPQPFIITSVNVDEVKFEIIDPPAPEDHWLFPSEGSIDGAELQLEVLNINDEQETRIARIRIYDAGNTDAEDTVVVYQRSSIEPYIILVPASKVDVDSAGQTFIIQTFSNLQNNHLIPDSIELYESDPTTVLSGDTMISITVIRNSSSFSQRSSFITFTNDEYEVEEVFYWQQNKQSEIPITVSGRITAADQGVNQVTVYAGDSTALTNSEGYYELNLKKGWFGSIVPKNGTHYFDPSEITYTVNDPLSIDTEGIDFDAYIINPAVSLAFDSTAICGVNQLDSSMVEYPTPTVTGTYGQEEYRWTTDPLYQHTIVGDSLLYPTFMPDDTITYTYVLTLYNNADSAKASFDLKVKPRPKAREIKGDFSVCKNQSGQVYTVLERSADEYFVWGFPNGGGSFNDKSDFHSNIVLVNWDKEPGEDISLSLITLKDGCSANDTIIQPITFTGNSSSPNNTRVFQKSGEDFLYCDDEDASEYRWGWFEIEDGTSEISAPDYFSDRNQWYCRLPDDYPANSKSIHYFVETKHKEEDCYSRFFLNDDIPVGLNENSFGLIEIFPNPTDDAINIRFNTVELNGDVEISIYDLAGNKVYNETFERLRNNSVISIKDTQYFNRGLYVVQILYGKRSFQSKIIVR